MSVVSASLSISESLQEGFNSFFGFIPNLIGFLVILLIGFVIARLIRAAITKGLEALGLDKALHDSPAGEYVEKFSPGASPSKLIGIVAFWFIFLFVLTAALSALKIPAVTAFMTEVLSYLPNVIAAIIIFALAAAIAGAIGGVVAKLLGDTPTGKVVASVVPALIMVIAVFMILNQLKIAPAIVSITYTALIGSVALGAALAFGLGGRDVAGRMLEDAYQKGREQKGQVERDVQLGKDRAEEKAEEGKQRLDDKKDSSGGPAAEPA
ncbi:MAG: mechanosensitive ion channel [Solirubrobacterales bacterium]